MASIRLSFLALTLAAMMFQLGDSFTTTTWYPRTTGYNTSNCGSVYTTYLGIVTSPNYPGSYAPNLNCLQTIAVPFANSIQITFVDLNVYYYSSYDCRYDYVEVTGCDDSVTRYCYNLDRNPIVFPCSRTYAVRILFHTYMYTYSYLTGFKLLYQANMGSNCSNSGGAAPLGGGGYVVSPLYPSTYPMLNDCYYVIQGTTSGTRIRVSFEQLSIYESSSCSVDYLKFYCLSSSPDEPLFVCGNAPRKPITFNCSSLEVWFHSQTQAPADGTTRNFKFFYIGVEGQTSVSAAARVFGSRQAISLAGLLLAGLRLVMFVKVA